MSAALPLVLGTQVKNESQRIGEWVTHHARLGFSRVYLVDDGSTDLTVERATYVGSGLVCPDPAGGACVRVISVPSVRMAGLSRVRNSAQTEAYRGSTALAVSIGMNFRAILERVRLDYPGGALLALFDVDEFLFVPTDPYTGPTSKLRALFDPAGVVAAFVPSCEVDDNTFSLDEPLLPQAWRAQAPDTREYGTRAGICKAVLRTHSAAPFFTQPTAAYGDHIHGGGLPPDHEGIVRVPAQELGILHYRKPMYDPEVNRRTCVAHYPWVARPLSHE